MNSKQLQYVLQLSKSRSFSQAAQVLKVSQPALSKQILALEKSLGLQLFDREASPLALTAAGEQFVRQAKELVYRQEQLERTMEQYRTGESGRLVIGVSPFRSLYLLPEALRRVKERFPGVQIDLHEHTSDVLRQEAAEGKYDFAVVNLPVDQSLLDVMPIEADTLVLVVPKRLLAHLPHAPANDLEPVDLADCARLPFVVVRQGQELRNLFDRLCTYADIHPQIAMEVVGLATTWAMARAGIGAALLPLQFVKAEAAHSDVALFTLKENLYIRQPVVVKRRGKLLTECAQFAMQLLTGEAKTE